MKNNYPNQILANSMQQLAGLAIRTWFTLTTRLQASRRIRVQVEKYLQLADRLDASTGGKIVNVPEMPGVDQDMRNWSFFMLLEHNAIVNRSIRALVEHLATGRELAADALIDPAKDVLPQPAAGQSAVRAFQESCENYLALVETLPQLRGTARLPHPLFGPFNAHLWHCMFGFHLLIHFRQARLIHDGALAN